MPYGFKDKNFKFIKHEYYEDKYDRYIKNAYAMKGKYGLTPRGRPINDDTIRFIKMYALHGLDTVRGYYNDTEIQEKSKDYVIAIAEDLKNAIKEDRIMNDDFTKEDLNALLKTTAEMAWEKGDHNALIKIAKEIREMEGMNEHIHRYEKIGGPDVIRIIKDEDSEEDEKE